jgi:TetR/AcrR family transcriptional regulator, transcriptional repressor for nem operon
MPRPREFDRDKVIQQAMNVFWEHGYEATSINKLTEATNLKSGSLYNTFGSKHALYLDALDHYEAHMGSNLFAVLDEPISGLDAIRTLFYRLVESALVDPRGCFMQNAIMERAACDSDVEQRACAGKAQGTAAFKRALDRAHAAGEIAPEANTEDTARYLVGVVYAVRTLARTTGSRDELRSVVEIALSVLA